MWQKTKVKKTQNVHTQNTVHKPPHWGSNSRSQIQPAGTLPLDYYPDLQAVCVLSHIILLFRAGRYFCRYPLSILFPLRFSLSSVFPFLCSLVCFPFFVFSPLPFLGFHFIFLSCVSCSWFSFSRVLRVVFLFCFSFSLFLLLSFCVCLLNATPCHIPTPPHQATLYREGPYR